MVHPRRSGSDSRCCDSVSDPCSWRDWVDDTHQSVLTLEGWLSTLIPVARAIEQGEIDDLFEAAARGELSDSGDQRTPIKPVRIDPEIFELRRTALNKMLRFYHGEPTSLPKVLVALHRHIKTDDAAQQDEIEHAAARYDMGRQSHWL